MDAFKDSVKKSFQACKGDIETLKEENSSLKNTISLLNTQISDLKSDLIEIKDLIKDSKQEPHQIEISKPALIEPIHKKEKEIPKDPYEALLAFKAKANKRDVLKQKMMAMISENGMNLAELKFMFVDHFKYTSKATFYNYLKELELERQIRIERENSKNFVYLTGIGNRV